MKDIIRPEDTPELRRQLQMLLDRGSSVRRPSPWHVKIGPVNFFPTTGRVTTDPCVKHERRGFEYFLEIVEKLRAQQAADADREIRLTRHD